MAILIDSVTKVFDRTIITLGSLVYARHYTWTEGRAGFVTAVSEAEIIVQYHPGIGNVTNHFMISATEVADKEWELRGSEDLITVWEEAAGGDAD